MWEWHACVKHSVKRQKQNSERGTNEVHASDSASVSARRGRKDWNGSTRCGMSEMIAQTRNCLHDRVSAEHARASRQASKEKVEWVSEREREEGWGEGMENR